jgi:uncharacterized protein YfaS (alpha-2-macroglobulin family)
MSIPTDVKASIDKHLQAVRDNLSDKEEAVQNEILDGLRDHINEALARGGKPVTTETVEAIIAAMDDPASYAEDPQLAVVSTKKRQGGMTGNKWLYVALAFLLINSIGVWKLIQIERKTGNSGDGSPSASHGKLVVPHVASDNKAGIRYPEADKPDAPVENPQANAPAPGVKSFRSVSFLENRNPVLLKSDQELSWLFSADVVAQSAVGKPLAQAPMKFNPEVAGEFSWKSPKELLFKPKNPWLLGQSFTAELAGDFKASGGETYEGTRFWRFSTTGFDLEKFTQSPKRGAFLFHMSFSMPAKPESLTEKLKLFYLNANGEKLPLDFTVKFDPEGTTAAIETAIVPAISFQCDIDANLQPLNWPDSTRGKIERKLPNSQLFSLNSASFDRWVAGKPTVSLVFTSALSEGDLSNFIEITPKVETVLSENPGSLQQMRLSGDFVPGVAYEIKVKSGLTSRNGSVIPYNTTRSLVLPIPSFMVAGAPAPATERPKPRFDGVYLNLGPQALIGSGNQELRWRFASPVVAKEAIGQNLAEPPISLSPATAGNFFWASAYELVFKPNLEWDLNQFYEARLTAQLVNLAGTEYSGVRFWTFSSPAMTIREANQMGGGAGLSFALRFSLLPEAESMKKHLKVFCHDAAGAKTYLPFEIDGDHYNSVSKLVRIPTAPTCRLYFELEPGFQPVRWKQGIKEKIEIPGVITTVLRVNSVTQSGGEEKTPSIRIQFSEHVDVKSAAAFIEMSPTVEFTVQKDSRRQNTLSLFGPFVPDREYQVKVKPGLVSERGYLLLDESTTTVAITRAAASLGFVGAGGYLSPTGSLLVPITFQNLSECKVSVAPVMASNLVYFARNNSSDSSYNLPAEASGESQQGRYNEYDYEDGYSYRGRRNIEDVIGNVTHKNVSLSGELNKETTDYLKLRDFTKTKGAYLVQIRGQDAENANSYRRNLSDSRLVVVTDLGISAKSSMDNVFVWVCSLKDAKPAGGVEVTAYSANNQLIAKAVTNADGVAAIPCNAGDKNARPFLVTAQLADDLSYLRLDQHELQGDLTESTRDYRTTGAEAFLFTDRGIFRPGETLHARTMIRNPDFTAPAAFPVVFQIIKPDGRMFKEITAMPNEFGAADVETIMPDYLPTGRYTLRLRVPQAKEDMGSTTFLLEDFVPPQIRVSVTTDQERVAATEKIKANIFAEHLFGAPAAGLKANIKCIYSPVSFAPKQWSDYQFGAQAARFWGGQEANSFAMQTRDIDNLILDENGKTTAEIASDIPANAPGPIQALVQASVFEQSGRSITATKKAVIDPYPFYIGIKRIEGYWLKSGESHKLTVIAVLPNGETHKPVKPVTVKLSQIDWNYNYKRTPDGRYTYEGHKVVTLLKEEVLDLSSGTAEYQFTPTGYGQNELSITDPDSGSMSAFTFYASDYEQSWTTTQRDKPDSLTLKLDKPEYQIGETAKLTIQAPFSGTALLTIESDKVLQSRVILLDKNTAEVDVEVKDSYTPNVHCTVSVIRPAVAEAVWKGHRAFGSVPLKISPRNHRINVALETPQTMLPQSKLKTRILLTDDAGQPVDGEVTLIAVDEAICMLTSLKTPSPLNWLYELRRLGVDSHDVYSELMEVLDESVLVKKSNPGGDGGGDDAAAAERLTKRLNPIKANRFKPVSLWASRVAVTKGVAEVEMNVPEFTGELRVMAVACNARQLGSAQGMVKVKRPLIVQPSLPRFLAPGDECLMDVTVFNEMGEDITAKLQITCGGPLSTKLNEQNIELKKGASVSVSIPMVAGNLPGKALCTVTCEAGTVRFTDTIEIAVRPPISAEVIADSGSLAPGKTLEILAPANWLPESVLRRLQVSKEPTLELGHGFQYLLRYPYGCIEQTTSAAFPLLYLPDLANRTFDKSMGKDAARDYVMSGVWRILSMQQANGGFSYWSGSYELCPWGTSYATHFLVEAKKAGYEVPKIQLERALQAVRRGLDSSSDDKNSYGNIYDQRAYACYVLAIAGEPEHPWQARMLEMKDKLSYYARLLNASAMLVQGEPKRAVPLLKELGLPSAGQRDQGGCFNSPNRNASLLLSAWLDIDPKNDDVLKLVQTLGKAKINGYWGTTQDNAMALMALGKYARRMKQENPDFKAMITLPNGTTEAFDQSKDREWLIERSETGAILLTNQGPGNLYYSFESEGVPVDLAEYYKKLTAKNEGMSVQREWLDDKGNPVDITKLKQNDLVVAKITLNPNGHTYDNVAIEDLLPAGLEIENPNLDTTQSLPWINEKSQWCARKDIRDDRILLFTRPFSGVSTFYYLARAVTPGKYVVPSVSAECMYEPDVRSVTSQSEMTITK